jgi:hypothetical protein
MTADHKEGDHSSIAWVHSESTGAVILALVPDPIRQDNGARRGLIPMRW